jgi:hypothetical protein
MMPTTTAALQITGAVKTEPLRKPMKSIFHLHNSQMG